MNIRCLRCRQNVSKCKETGKPLQQCKYGERHSFIVSAHVPQTAKDRKVKLLQTRDIDEAIVEAIAFQKEVAQSSQLNETPDTVASITPSTPIPETPQEKPEQVTEKAKPLLIYHSTAQYIHWITKGPKQVVRNYSPAHLADIEKSLGQFTEALEAKGFDINSLTVAELNDVVISHYYEYLDEKGLAGRTINKKTDMLRNWIDWNMDYHDTPRRNFFDRVARRPQDYTPKAISETDYLKIMDYPMNIENGWGTEGDRTKRRNFYHPALKDIIRASLLCGRRRSELLALTWANLVYSEDGKTLIAISARDLKVEAMKKLLTPKTVYIPITPDVMAFLNDLSYEANKGSNNYIIAPSVTGEARDRLPDIATRGFSHYARLAGLQEGVTLKQCRKQYLTQLNLHTHGRAHEVSGHGGGQAVLNNHYVSQLEVARSVSNSDFQVFKTDKRKGELEAVKAKQEPISNHKHIIEK